MLIRTTSSFTGLGRMLAMPLVVCVALALLATPLGCKNKKPPKDDPKAGEEAPKPDPKPSAMLPDPRNTVPATGDMTQVSIIYSVGARRMLGHLVRYADPGTAPILLLLHDEKGIDDWLRQRAEAYARLGYIVLCPDLSELMNETFDQPVIDNVMAAIAQTENQLQRKPVGRYAAIGWGHGGGQALTLARYMNLDAIVICYGDLITSPEALQKVREPVLGIFGRLDDQVPVTTVEEFQKIMEQMGGRFEGNIWGKEGHGFMRTPVDPNDAREADLEIINWLDTYFVP